MSPVARSGPAPTGAPQPRARGLRDAVARATSPGAAPPTGRLAQLAYGAALPLLGLRALLTRPALWRYLPAPALATLAVCVAAALGFEAVWPGRASFVQAFYAVFAVIATGPVVLFSNHYARLAARARAELLHRAAPPRLLPLGHVVRDAVAQAGAQYAPMLVAVLGLLALFAGVAFGGVAFSTFDKFLPLVSFVGPAVYGVGTLWLAVWVMVEAIESARVAGQPGLDDARAPRLARRFRMIGVGFLMARWSRPWWGELALIEERPWLSVGFLASAGLLCSAPVLQLALRPALLVAAVHLLAPREAAVASGGGGEGAVGAAGPPTAPASVAG